MWVTPEASVNQDRRMGHTTGITLLGETRGSYRWILPDGEGFTDVPPCASTPSRAPEVPFWEITNEKHLR